ncbi:hypothetical protein J6TS7_07010 [Paenibacillus dendritiformis]|nr:hypothetical protein J6TS7_07010 [Paenibacillus dendritiformis]
MSLEGKPQSAERTFEGYVKNSVPIDKETKLFTNSPGFSNVGNPGGEFKRFGSDSQGSKNMVRVARSF